METQTKFLIEYAEQFFVDTGIDETVLRLKTIIRHFKLKPKKGFESKGMISWDFNYEQVRRSLKLYGKVNIKLSNGSIIMVKTQ